MDSRLLTEIPVINDEDVDMINSRLTDSPWLLMKKVDLPTSVQEVVAQKPTTGDTELDPNPKLRKRGGASLSKKKRSSLITSPTQEDPDGNKKPAATRSARESKSPAVFTKQKKSTPNKKSPSKKRKPGPDSEQPEMKKTKSVSPKATKAKSNKTVTIENKLPSPDSRKPRTQTPTKPTVKVIPVERTQTPTKPIVKASVVESLEEAPHNKSTIMQPELDGSSEEAPEETEEPTEKTSKITPPDFDEL